jgi:hypothetical protein
MLLTAAGELLSAVERCTFANDCYPVAIVQVLRLACDANIAD